ncbi:hypothetical protein ABDK09_12195 [Vibrio sp. CDRSL-10 TSBA]
MKKKLQLADSLNAKRYLRTSNNKHRTVFEGTGSTQISSHFQISTLFRKPVLPAPKQLDLSDNGLNDELSAFFIQLETLLELHKHIYLSFEETVVARLPMFLLIVALQDKYEAKISIIWSKKSPSVNWLIRDAGSFLPAAERRTEMFNADIPRIPVISGSNQEFDELSEALVDAIRDKYYDGDIPPNIESRISQAIIETLENVGRHAYPNEPLDSSKRWWLICSIGRNYVSKQDRYMYLAIYDRGRGIPLSFEDSQVFQNRVKKHYPKEYRELILGEDSNLNKVGAVRGLLRSMKSYVAPLRDTIGDSGLIYASMMHEITRIDDANHGQGSVSIKDVVTKDPDSRLLIFSNKGCYQYNKGSEEEHSRFEYQNETIRYIATMEYKFR